MEATGQHHDGHALQAAHDQLARVAHHAGRVEVGDVGVGDGHRVGQILHDGAQTTAQHDDNLGHQRRARAHKGHAVGNLG